MKIEYLKRIDIDIDKYDACIENATNSRIYALSYYLDVVADYWDVLIYNDYEAVMPLPWRSKYFIKYIYPPCWTQQLGVFSVNEIDTTLVDTFIKAIPKKFLKVTLHLNSGCKTSLQTTTKDNYILYLNQNYEVLKAKFNKNRKRVLAKAKNKALSIRATSEIELVKIAKKNYNYLSYTDNDYTKLCKLASVLNRKKKSFTYGVYHDNILIGGVCFLKDDFRITYLFSVMTDEGQKKHAITFLLDYILKKYENEKKILDFEGSMVASISKFFRSFGAFEEKYFQFKTNAIQRNHL